MKYRNFKKSQSGFTLIELVVVVGLLIGLAALSGIFSFSGDKAKSATLLQSGRMYSDALLRLRQDTGITPRHANSLYLKGSNLAANNFEGVDATTTWRGPYVNGFPADANGDVRIDNLGAGAVMKIEQVTAGLPTGMSTGYALVFEGMSDELVREAVSNCNSTDVSAALPTDYSNGNKCLGTARSGSTPGSVKLLYSMAP